MMSKNEVRKIRSRLQKKLDKIGEQLGWKLTLGNARFRDTIVFNLEVSIPDAKGHHTTQGESDWKLQAKRFDMNEKWFGETFLFRNEKYKIVGLKPRSRKFPILCECLTGSKRGRNFKFSVEHVRQLMGALIR